MSTFQETLAKFKQGNVNDRPQIEKPKPNKFTIPKKPIIEKIDIELDNKNAQTSPTLSTSTTKLAGTRLIGQNTLNKQIKRVILRQLDNDTSEDVKKDENFEKLKNSLQPPKRPIIPPCADKTEISKEKKYIRAPLPPLDLSKRPPWPKNMPKEYEFAGCLKAEKDEPIYDDVQIQEDNVYCDVQSFGN